MSSIAPWSLYLCAVDDDVEQMDKAVERQSFGGYENNVVQLRQKKKMARTVINSYILGKPMRLRNYWINHL
jgi:hypothetical protein